jgi:hypothetical protein
MTPVASASPTPAKRPATMPIPPPTGVSRSCQRSPLGLATRRRGRIRRVSQMTAAETGRAAIAAIAVIGRER